MRCSPMTSGSMTGVEDSAVKASAAPPRSQRFGRSPTSESRTSRQTSSRSAGSDSSSVVPASRAETSDPRHSTPSYSASSRSTPTNGLWRSSMFDLDDIEAAFEELDARYLAGEAAAYADTWSAVAKGYAAFNRRESPATTPDWVNVDHRLRATFEAADLPAYLGVTRDQTPDLRIYIEAVHRLSDLGAVVTMRRMGPRKTASTPSGGSIALLTVEGDAINRGELFDEADLDAALARFEELSRPAPRLENAASRAYERFWTYFVARDWTALTEVLPDNFSLDDRRRTVNAGVRHGRDAEIANLRAIARMGITTVTPTVIATRGERLALNRVDLSDRDGPGDLYTEVLAVMEIGRRAARRGRPVRPRRHRRRLRGTRRAVPRRRSRRLRAHMVGHRKGIRCAQPARARGDDAGLGEHRPPARDSVRAR